MKSWDIKKVSDPNFQLEGDPSHNINSLSERKDYFTSNISSIMILLKWFVNKWVGLGCRFKANCPLLGPGPVGGVRSVGQNTIASWGTTFTND